MGFLDKPKEHDPGGRQQWPLMAGVKGDCLFSHDGQYRHWLRRRLITYPVDAPFILWIGMNPSAARDNFDDPTVRWEQNYTFRELQCGHYIKCNAYDYRATNPETLLKIKPMHPDNRKHILWFMSRAKSVICCWGKLPDKLQDGPNMVKTMIRNLGVEAMCLGTNLDGSPKHPLYIKGTTKLVSFRVGRGRERVLPNPGPRMRVRPV